MIITPLSNLIVDAEQAALWCAWADLPPAVRHDPALWVRVEEIPDQPDAYAVIFGTFGDTDELDGPLIPEIAASSQARGTYRVQENSVQPLISGDRFHQGSE